LVGDKQVDGQLKFTNPWLSVLGLAPFSAYPEPDEIPQW
jgi:hypothetical protein